VPDVLGAQSGNAVDSSDAILIAIGSGKLDYGKLH
jgi:hypothetical protein